MGFEFDVGVWSGMELNGENENRSDGGMSDLGDGMGIGKVGELMMGLYGGEEVGGVKKGGG